MYKFNISLLKARQTLALVQSNVLIVFYFAANTSSHNSFSLLPADIYVYSLKIRCFSIQFILNNYYNVRFVNKLNPKNPKKLFRSDINNAITKTFHENVIVVI
jgi:hypothetical protein